MSKRARRYCGLAIFATLVVLLRALIHTGAYGWTVFIVVPWALGGLACWVFPPRTGKDAAATGAVAVFIGCLLLLMAGIEGGICILMAAPLTLPFGAAGGYLVYQAMAAKVGPRNVSVMLLLPIASLTFDLTVPPKVFKVHSEVIVAATPEQVWKHVVTFSDLPDPGEWYFRTGLAYPKRARIEGSGPGAIRYCEFSTGPFVEPIDIWDQPRLLAFHVTQNPAPMSEWSPYANVLPKHLHGYLISKHGEFRLTPLPDGRTLLEGTTWYQHGLWPAEYWRWWSDAIIHRIHLRVLNHVKMLAETEIMVK